MFMFIFFVNNLEYDYDKTNYKRSTFTGSLNAKNWGHIPPNSMLHRNY